MENEHQAVGTLLCEWGFGELVEKFAEESIDIEALENLLLDDIKLLIPSIGLRTKFRLKWTQWRNRNTVSFLNENSIYPACSTRASTYSTASNAVSSDSEAVADTQSSANNTNEQITTCSHTNQLQKLLEKNVQHKILINKQKLSKTERCLISKVVIEHLINITPGSILKPAQLEQWANYAIELFPEEDKKFYFFSVGAESLSSSQSVGSRRLPLKGRRYYGCLWDKWNNERKKLRQKQIIPFVKKDTRSGDAIASQNIQSEFEEHNDQEVVIKSFQGQEPTQYLKDAWNKTRNRRVKRLSEQKTTEEYFKAYPLLNIQNVAVELIHEDYSACAEVNPAINLVEELQKYCMPIVKLGRAKFLKFRDKSQRKVVGQIFDFIDAGNQENISTGAILLLPFLFSSGGKVNQRGKKASRAEAADAFIVLYVSLADGENALEERRKSLINSGCNIQPFVLAIGKSWSDVTSAYVVVDKPLYRFNNILDAVQMCFKVFFAFDLSYPLECEHVWQLIQRAFFKIILASDKIILGVNQILEELSTLSIADTED